MNITTALVIADPWIGMILDGSKTWEMRSTSTSRRGWIGLIRKGTGCVWGIARIAECGDPMSSEEMIETFVKHRIPEQMICSGAVAKWNRPWKLEDVKTLANPVPYIHKSGAVIWVTLDDQVSQAIARELTTPPVQRLSSDSVSTPTKPDHQNPSMSKSVLQAERRSTHGTSSEKLIGEAELTDGNIKNSHIYLRHFIHKFPGDAIGGSNATQAASRKVRVDWGGAFLIETDLDGDKKFFRSRSWIRMFFERFDAKAGDRVQIIETSPYHYRLELIPT
jgi:hypothetical protein